MVVDETSNLSKVLVLLALLRISSASPCGTRSNSPVLPEFDTDLPPTDCVLELTDTADLDRLRGASSRVDEALEDPLWDEASLRGVALPATSRRLATRSLKM
jgi:hypothetical protein